MSTQVKKDFGTFTSNGVLYVNGAEAVLLDTPPTANLTRQLMDWFVGAYPNARIKAAVINHSHSDCLGGLAVLHEYGIISYGRRRMPALLKRNGHPFPPPRQTFNRRLIVSVGDTKIVNFYPGHAHSQDNIVSYIEADDVLFGGCMVKTLGAGFGNTADANVFNWPKAIANVEAEFPKPGVVIPGHGSWGDGALLEYTKRLFDGYPRDDRK